ncbi:MAG TPA: MIP/aquaporin family protein [Chitinophagaceae bacterium]|nr:MIP/aquaporin family protein [Chitinophagaceae bacterium]
MHPFLGEFIGTAILIILGQGVVANVVLNKTKGQNSGWIVITFGWAIAVFTGIFVASHFSKAHLNPAFTLAAAYIGNGFSWADVPAYIAGQFLGAMTGALIVWLAYKLHFIATPDADGKLAVFCTAPAIRSTPNNLITEMIGTFILVFAALYIAAPASTLGALDALPVALVVLGVGLSLGGPTGYAINPARDLGPRIMHAILPIPGKRDSDWNYAWIPVLGPVVGGMLAGVLFKLL